MRILLTATASYVPPRGGATRSNLIWLDHLARAGHACRIVCGPSGEGAELPFHESIAVTARGVVAAWTCLVVAADTARPAQIEGRWSSPSTEGDVLVAQSRSPRSSSPATMERPAAGQAATTRTCGCALSTMGSGPCPLSPRSCCRSTAVARPPEQPPVSRQPSGRAASRDRMGRALSDKVVTSRCTHAVRAAGVEDPPELRPGRWTRR